MLKEAENGKVMEVIRHHGIAQKTDYNWKAKYGGLEVSEARRLRALEEENRRLKKLVANQALDISLLKELLGKDSAAATRRVSQRRACGLVSRWRSVERYRLCWPEPAELRERMRALAEQRPRFGYRRIHVLLRALAARGRTRRPLQDLQHGRLIFGGSVKKESRRVCRPDPLAHPDGPAFGSTI
jgi:hypothetical protein